MFKGICYENVTACSPQVKNFWNYPLFLSFQVEWEEEASQNGDENESAPDDDVCNFFTWKRQVPIFWFRSAVRSWTEKTPYYFQDSIILRLAYSRVFTLTGGLCEDHSACICHFLTILLNLRKDIVLPVSKKLNFALFESYSKKRKYFLFDNIIISKPSPRWAFCEAL